MYTLDPVQQHLASAELQKGTTLTLEFLKRLQNLFLCLLNNPFIPFFFPFFKEEKLFCCAWNCGIILGDRGRGERSFVSLFYPEAFRGPERSPSRSLGLESTPVDSQPKI